MAPHGVPCLSHHYSITDFRLKKCDLENGVITFDEFVRLMRNQERTETKKAKYDEKQLWEQFKMFDKVLGMGIIQAYRITMGLSSAKR